MEKRVVSTQVATIVGAIIVMEYLVDSGALPSLFFTSPTQIIRTLPTFFPTYAAQMVVTIWRFALAFVFTALAGIGLGFLISQSELLYQLVNPIVGFGMVSPKVVFIPLFLLVFGAGYIPIVAFGAFLGVFPVILNTAAAIRETRKEYLTLARSLGYSKIGIHLRVVLPSALPTIFTGLFLGSNLTMTGVLIMEMSRGLYGIGPLMSTLSSEFRMVELYDAIALTILLTLGINFVFWYLSRRFSSWRLV